MRQARSALIAAGVPLALVLAGMAFSPQSWLPLVGPHGPHGAVLWSAAAVLAGQQDGVLIYAPAIALGLPGLRLLWRDGGAPRIAAVEAVAGVAAMLLTAGWRPDAPRALAIPGAAAHAGAAPARRADWALGSAQRTSGGTRSRWRACSCSGASLRPPRCRSPRMALWPAARDGSSALLEWLGSSRELIRAAPIAPPAGNDPVAFAVSTLIWMAVAAGLWWLTVRTPADFRGWRGRHRDDRHAGSPRRWHRGRRGRTGSAAAGTRGRRTSRGRAHARRLRRTSPAAGGRLRPLARAACGAVFPRCSPSMRRPARGGIPSRCGCSSTRAFRCPPATTSSPSARSPAPP